MSAKSINNRHSQANFKCTSGNLIESDQLARAIAHLRSKIILGVKGACPFLGGFVLRPLGLWPGKTIKPVTSSTASKPGQKKD
jgi:hypothetical protein